MSTLSLKIEFGGGLELLFDNKRSHRISIPARVKAKDVSSDLPGAQVASNQLAKPADARYLIYWLKDNLLKEHAELFVDEGTVYARSGSCIVDEID